MTYYSGYPTDYHVYLVDLPATVNGLIVEEADGTFTIYINATLNDERQRATLEHELRHRGLDHFHQERPVAMLEREAGKERYYAGRTERYCPSFDPDRDAGRRRRAD